MKRFFALCLTLGLYGAQAQFFESEEYNWDEPEYEKVSLDDSTDMSVLLNKEVFRYFYDEQSLKQDYLIHRKLHVNSHEAIENLNTVYISETMESGGLVQFKARVINPDGKITEIKEDDILTGTPEDSEREYTYFALEGLEVGSQVEYFYIKRTDPDYNGKIVNLQEYFPVHRLELDIVTPGNLVFVGKIYNLDTSFAVDTTLEEENRLYLYLDTLAPLKKVENGYREPNLVRAIFKLDQNLYNGKRNIVSYKHTTQSVVDAINAEYDRREDKALKKILKELEEFESPSGNTVRKVEDYLKTNYHFVNASAEELTNLASIYENKAYNYYGGLRLYSRLFKEFEIPYQMVYTTDRSEIYFDKDFETNVFLDDLLFYLSDEDEYIDYTNPMSRLGYISSMNRYNHGLFIDQMELDGNVVGISSVKFIKHKPESFTIDSLDVVVEFGEDLYENELKINRSVSGYLARYYQPLLEFIKDEDDKKEFEESLLKYIDSEAKVAEMEVENGEGNLLGVKPLRVHGTLEEARFMEKAGPNFLFKIGLLIGPQAEMYEDPKERVTDVESDHARTYSRSLHFSIPEGYELSGLESLNMDEKMMYNDEVSARFVSTYQQEGNEVVVNITEYYKEVVYPKESFEDYRRVINAAADFNKKTLLLKKI